MRDTAELFLFFNEINHADMFLFFDEALFENILQTDKYTLLTCEEFLYNKIHVLFNYITPMNTKIFLTVTQINQAAHD